MIGIVLALLTIAAMFTLAIRRDPLWAWAALVAVVTLVAEIGLFGGRLHLPATTAGALAAGSLRLCWGSSPGGPSGASWSRGLPSAW